MYIKLGPQTINKNWDLHIITKSDKIRPSQNTESSQTAKVG